MRNNIFCQYVMYESALLTVRELRADLQAPAHTADADGRGRAPATVGQLRHHTAAAVPASGGEPEGRGREGGRARAGDVLSACILYLPVNMNPAFTMVKNTTPRAISSSSFGIFSCRTHRDRDRDRSRVRHGPKDGTSSSSSTAALPLRGWP